MDGWVNGWIDGWMNMVLFAKRHAKVRVPSSGFMPVLGGCLPYLL